MSSPSTQQPPGKREKAGFSEFITDENSLAEPCKVAPRTEELTLPGPLFTRSFLGNSLTVLRIPVAK